MISLNGSLRTCKVNTAYANRIQSERFENPDLMVCPVWQGTDSTGRPVCPDSFMTKSAGCNSAEDRVLVENYLRPNYAEYITLNTEGINQETNMHTSDMQCAVKNNREGFATTGNFGGNPNSGQMMNNCASCTSGYTSAYNQAMTQENLRNQVLANNMN